MTSTPHLDRPDPDPALDPATAPRATTPPDRDRYADLLRLSSIGVVAVGHWVVALLTLYGAGSVSTAMPAMLATWVWQVMALFFFVGGFAHARALRHDPPLRRFLPARLARLLPPVVAMLGAWTAVALVARIAGLDRGVVARGLHIVTVPLWFLGVYLVVVLAAPAMLRLHRRFGLVRVVATLAVLAGLVDALARVDGLWLVGYANMAVVWLAVHQLGYGYADGTLTRGDRHGGRRVGAALAAGGLAATVLLVFGPAHYPVLMVGLPGNETANSSPATLALLTQSVFLVGLALLARPAATRLVARPRAWFAVAAGNRVIMTIFCWHLSACYLVQGALLAAGTSLPAADTPRWFAGLVLWLAGCALCCAALVALCRRFERTRPAAAVSTRAAVTGVSATALGLFVISVTGLDHLLDPAADPAAALSGLPLHAPAALALVVGGLLLTRGRRAQPVAPGGSVVRKSASSVAVSVGNSSGKK